MSERQQQIALDVRQGAKQGCAMLAVGCAIVMMACMLGGVAVWWRGGELPALNEHVGAYWIVGHATVAPGCSPLVLCTQQFADVPLPRYYVVWLISEGATNHTGTRVLAIPLTFQRP